MKKVFDFVESLTPLFYVVLGYPTINFSKEIIEVYFECNNTIRDLSIFDVSGPDEFRMFSKGSSIICVFTFYVNND